MADTWKPMFLVPTDGTPVCALHADMRWVTAVRIYNNTNFNPNGIFVAEPADLTDTGYKLEHFAGWCELPSVPAWVSVPIIVEAKKPAEKEQD